MSRTKPQSSQSKSSSRSTAGADTIKSSLTYFGVAVLVTAVLIGVFVMAENAEARAPNPPEVVTEHAPETLSEAPEEAKAEPGWLDGIRAKLLGDASQELDEREAALDAREAEFEAEMLKAQQELDAMTAIAETQKSTAQKVLKSAESTRAETEQTLFNLQTCIANAGG